MSKTKTLWRAADDDLIVGSASFSASREAAEAYLDNPGFGGGILWVTEIEVDAIDLLDLYDLDEAEALDRLMAVADLRHPGAIGPDEWIPRIADRLQDAGIEWVRVRESYPAGTETWIFVGSDDPEMIEAD